MSRRRRSPSWRSQPALPTSRSPRAQRLPQQCAQPPTHTRHQRPGSWRTARRPHWGQWTRASCSARSRGTNTSGRSARRRASRISCEAWRATSSARQTRVRASCRLQRPDAAGAPASAVGRPQQYDGHQARPAGSGDILRVYSSYGCGYVAIAACVNGICTTSLSSVYLAGRADNVRFSLRLSLHYSSAWANTGPDLSKRRKKELSSGPASYV
jgi:hypothetical protein